MDMALSPQFKKTLRARAHGLKPVVLVGNNGLSPAVIAEAEQALIAHELIKVRLHEGDRKAIRQASALLCQHLEAELIQSIGKVVVLYRQQPDSEHKPTRSSKVRPSKEYL